MVPLSLARTLHPARPSPSSRPPAATALRCSGFSKGHLGATGYFPLGIQTSSLLRLSPSQVYKDLENAHNEIQCDLVHERLLDCGQPSEAIVARDVVYSSNVCLTAHASVHAT